MTYYDDNFGRWENMNDWEMRKFYDRVQKESVVKICVDCGRRVKIMPDYECCGPCADRRENGGW